MGRPLRVDTTTTPVSLKELTDDQIGYVARLMLGNIITSNTGTLTGELNIGGIGTPIGSFVDTTRIDPVGTHPVTTTVNSITYTLNQVLDTVVDSGYTKALEYNGGLYGLKEMVMDETNEVYKNAAAQLDYYLQPLAPALPGTWETIASLTDTLIDGTVTTANLWKKTTSEFTEPVTRYRPIKLNGITLKEMTDAEITESQAAFQNSVIASGIGQYRLSENAPVEAGTWVQQGLGLVDTIHDVANVSYAGSYTGAFTGVYSKAFTGIYNQTYTSAYTGSYNQGYSRAFTGIYTGFFGGFAAGYAGSYVGTFTSAYAGTYNQGYTSAYTGSYTGAFTGVYSRLFTGTYTGLTVQLATITVANSGRKLWKRIA